MGRFELNKMGKRSDEAKQEKKVKLGKSYMNERSLDLREQRKKSE